MWDLTEGDEDARIDAAIERTEAFFNSVGVPTRLSGYGLGKEHVEPVLAALEAHRLVKLGEDRGVTLEVSRKVLELAV